MFTLKYTCRTTTPVNCAVLFCTSLSRPFLQGWKHVNEVRKSWVQFFAANFVRTVKDITTDSQYEIPAFEELKLVIIPWPYS